MIYYSLFLGLRQIRAPRATFCGFALDSLERLNIERGKVADYRDLNVSAKVIGIIQSYVPIVNRNIWRKTI
ncbi:hypothetical protein FACS1894216_11860 [Synergistales bacterium]|nr:hypothetical protein FACS1894216_11860 [Synergistales bacterium]